MAMADQGATSAAVPGLMFTSLDVVYGKPLTLSKFKVLELIARVPYMAWEQVAFIAITHVHADTGMARRIHERVATSRAQQDNEMYHLLIIEELIARSGQRQPQIKSSGYRRRSRSSIISCHGCSLW
jgi:ubiquinol oxidase